MLRSLPTVAFLLPFVPVFAPARAPQPLFGGGAVIAMQTALFETLDKGDAKSVAAFVDTGDQPASILAIDLGGHPVSARGHDGSVALLAKLAQESQAAGGTFTTKILSSDASCASRDSSYGVYDYERTHTVDGKSTTRHFQATSIVCFTDNGLKLVRMQVTEIPADAKR